MRPFEPPPSVCRWSPFHVALYGVDSDCDVADRTQPHMAFRGSLESPDTLEQHWVKDSSKALLNSWSRKMSRK